LEAELREARREAAALRGQLAAMEESHDHLRHRLGLMEEEYDGLQQSALQAEAQLKNTRVNLEDRKVFCQQLQEECESMNEQVGGWAERQRSNTELLLQRISELEAELQSLKTSHHKLQARYESIVKSNRDLQDQLTTKTQELEASGSSSSLLASSVTRITATLDLDLSQLAAGTNSSASHASAIASVPLQFNSQYCSTMEEGLSKMEDPGGVTVGDRTADEELDKEFWIRRAGELSVQLQHSSDYWSQKVRELSIQLEKQQQFPHRHNEFSD
jgi:chromosome segregation ATPase